MGPRRPKVKGKTRFPRKEGLHDSRGSQTDYHCKCQGKKKKAPEKLMGKGENNARNKAKEGKKTNQLKRPSPK